jgi:hypothetical protein
VVFSWGVGALASRYWSKAEGGRTPRAVGNGPAGVKNWPVSLVFAVWLAPPAVNQR